MVEKYTPRINSVIMYKYLRNHHITLSSIFPNAFYPKFFPTLGPQHENITAVTDKKTKSCGH